MNELLNLRKLAIKLGLPVEWLADHAESGDIPCLQVGEKLLFNLEAVKSALAERAARADVSDPASPDITLPPRPPDSAGGGV